MRNKVSVRGRAAPVRVQSVQNAAARLVTGTRRCDHTTPVLRQLHWLPVRQRVDFKVATFVHRISRPSVAVWHFADVLSRRLPSCRRCS